MIFCLQENSFIEKLAVRFLEFLEHQDLDEASVFLWVDLSQKRVQMPKKLLLLFVLTII